MESFMEVCKNTRDKLGRDLHKKEKEFLQWMYKRYEEEMQENKHISEYGPWCDGVKDFFRFNRRIGKIIGNIMIRTVFVQQELNMLNLGKVLEYTKAYFTFDDSPLSLKWILSVEFNHSRNILDDYIGVLFLLSNFLKKRKWNIDDILFDRKYKWGRWSSWQ